MAGDRHTLPTMRKIVRDFIGLVLILVGVLAVLAFLFFTLIVGRLPGVDRGQELRNDTLYLAVAIGSFTGAWLAWRRPQSARATHTLSSTEP